MTVSDAALRLKQLREQSGLSIRRMADELGMTRSRYDHYESRLKRPYLPAEFAMAVADVLSQHGIPREDVMALAGREETQPPADTLNLGPRYSRLSPRRQRMMREFLEDLEAAEAANPGIRSPASGGEDQAPPHE